MFKSTLWIMIFGMSAWGTMAIPADDSTEQSGDSASVAVFNDTDNSPVQPQSFDPIRAHTFGKSAGLSATQTEIQQRKRQLEQLYPDRAIFADSIIEQMILSDKFFSSLARVRPTDLELRAAFDTLQKHMPSSSWLSFIDALPLLEMQVLSSKVENQASVREKMESMQEEMLRNDVKAQSETSSGYEQPHTLPGGTEIVVPKMWSMAEIQISGLHDDCLAFTKDDGQCVVSVADFNKQALTMQLPATLPLDSARRLLLDKTLNMAYYLRKAEEMKLGDDPEIQKMLHQRTKAISRTGAPSRKISEESLKKLYDGLYKQLFAEREDVTLDIIGCSDSALLDSFFQVALKYESRSSRRGNTFSRASNIRIPWSRVAARELPLQLTEPTDTIPAGGITRPYKTPYGFFMARVAQIHLREEVPFKEAREQLFVVAQSDAPFPNSTADEKAARAYYKKHKQLFLAKDTVSLKVWLLPTECFIADSTVSSATYTALTFDSLSIKPILCRSSELPSTVWDFIICTSDSMQKGELIGPIKTVFGTWIMRVLGISRSGRQLSYEEAAPQIKALLGASPRSIAEIPVTEREFFVRNDLVATLAWRHTIESIKEPTPEEIELAIRTGAVSFEEFHEIPDLDPSIQKQMFVAQKLKEKTWRAAQEQWKTNIAIQDNYLYQ